MEAVGHGREGNRVLVLFFCFLFACFHDFGGFEICDQVPDLAQEHGADTQEKVFSTRNKNTEQTSSLKAYFPNNNSRNRLTFFFT